LPDFDKLKKPKIYDLIPPLDLNQSQIQERDEKSRNHSRNRSNFLTQEEYESYLKNKLTWRMSKQEEIF
jgi:hypothetical protein